MVWCINSGGQMFLYFGSCLRHAPRYYSMEYRVTSFIWDPFFEWILVWGPFCWMCLKNMAERKSSFQKKNCAGFLLPRFAAAAFLKGFTCSVVFSSMTISAAQVKSAMQRPQAARILGTRKAVPGPSLIKVTARPQHRWTSQLNKKVCTWA